MPVLHLDSYHVDLSERSFFQRLHRDSIGQVAIANGTTGRCFQTPIQLSIQCKTPEAYESAAITEEAVIKQLMRIIYSPQRLPWAAPGRLHPNSLAGCHPEATAEPEDHEPNINTQNPHSPIYLRAMQCETPSALRRTGVRNVVCGGEGVMVCVCN